MRTAMLLALVGCTVPPPTPRDPAATVLTIAEPPRVSIERALDDADSASVTADLVVWFSRDGDLFRQAPSQQPELIERALNVDVTAAASLDGVGGETDGIELVVLDGLPYAWDGLLLRPSPLSSALGGEFHRLSPDGERLWIETSLGLYRWDSDGLVEVTIDGEPVTRGFAVGGVATGQSVVWVATDDAIHAVPVAGGTVRVTHPVQASGLASDGYGLTWVLVGDDLFRVSREGELRDIGRSGVTHLLANPNDPFIWFGADDGWWRVRGLIAQQLSTEPVSEPIGLDTAGRLWTESDDGADRLAVERPIVLTGLSRGNVLDLERTLTVQPTDADAVSTVGVKLDDAPVEVGSDLTFGLDPSELEPGLHDLTITVAWLDGDVRSAARSIFVGLPFDVTWTDHIEPLHESRCARCHTDGTETIITDFASWRSRYGDILEQVESGAMPLTDTRLTADELALVVGWGNGGFLQ